MNITLSTTICTITALSAVLGDSYSVTNTKSSGPGSLAQAITDANGHSGQDTIAFAIPGGGVHIIDLSQTALPEITDAVVLDGYTQPGAHPNTLSVGDDAVILIQLDGGSTSNGANGPVVSAANCVVRGLAITGFQSAPSQYGSTFPPTGGLGLYLGSSASGSVVEGNFIGLNPDGQTARGSHAGVEIEGADAIIGGVDPAARNVIAANSSGVFLVGGSGTSLLGNYIGTDASGTRGLGNLFGVAVGATDVTIGGTDPGAGNLISGNSYDGIQLGTEVASHITASADRAVVQGNLIGTTADGVGALGNAGNGIEISRADDCTIGGLAANTGNVIAFNGTGVAVYSNGDRILSNAIYSNVGAGIAASTQSGLSAPVIIAEKVADGSATIQGTVQGDADSQVTVQLFADSQSLTTSRQTYLGSLRVTIDSKGNGKFSAKYALADTSVAFNATATDASGNTSKFARNPAYLLNLSSRAPVETGDAALIGGLIMEPGQIILRGIGPSLGPLGVMNALADPTLEVHGANGQLFDDNWNDDQNQAGEIQQSGLAPTNDLEAAIVPFGLASPFLQTSGFAPYTAIERGKNDTTGVGLVEAYGYGLAPNLGNISARGLVGTQDNVIIAGFIIGQGDETTRIVVRALGPSLKSAGVTNALADPVVELHNSNGAVIQSNDNWADVQSADLQTVGLAPSDAAESAILTRLMSGAYTAVVRGKNNTTGVALAEVYRLP